MSVKFTFTIDGQQIDAENGQTILEAAQANGVYIPRLCHMKGLIPFGSCRLCTVKVNGRHQSSCTQPAAPGLVVENESDEINSIRRDIIDMLFVEGNHYCMFCEKSGNCELQAQAYRLGITAPKFPFQFPDREIDMTHPEAFIDHDRCILCARCVRTSRDVDGKHVFDMVGRSTEKRIAVNAVTNDLSDTDLEAIDKAIKACPVGALMPKHVGFKIPVGQREYDDAPIGTDIENPAPAAD